MPIEPGEDEATRLNRNFDDLLQELRVSQNGTQILFAFLLTVPFSNGFTKTTDFQRALFLATLLLAAFSAAMLIAPAVMHRVLFHKHLKAELVRTASRIALGGQALLTLTVTGAVVLVADYIYSLPVAITLGVVTQLWWCGWFFVVPLRMEARYGRRDSTTSSM
jgi:hypothetical protein